MAARFGTSGLRGLVEELGDGVVVAHTRAFLRHLGNPPTLLIGRDLRDSSPTMAAAVAAAALAEGAEPIDCGALPTPALALESLRRAVPAVMVTGSHIPADRNGLKFYRPDGEIGKADEQAIFASVGDLAGESLPPASPVPSAEAARRYRDRYASLAPAVSLRGLRVGIYQHSTVARDLLVDVLDALGATVVPLGRAQTFVPVDTEALRPEDVALVHGWGAEHELDAIVSADGDADRPLIADEHGTFLRGDVIGLLTSRAIGAQTVVTPVTSTSAVELTGAFAKAIRTRVGSPHVIAGMAGQSGVVVGFEANGGVLLGTSAQLGGIALSALPTRDALLPIVAILDLATRSNMPLSALIATLPQRHTASAIIRDVNPDTSASLVGRLATNFAFAAQIAADSIASADTTDGTKLMLGSGDVVHLRPSGNAPELRCYAESTTAAAAVALAEAVRDRTIAALAGS